MRLCVVLAVIVCGAFQAWSAEAKSIEIRSENFIFVGDVSEADARKLVRDLEIFRKSILALTGVRGAPEIRPIRIYGVKDVRTLRDMTGLSGVSGVYTMSGDAPVFVMEMSGGVRDRDPSRAIALHEYAHHVLHAFTLDYYPRWYDEGFAEYLATFSVDGDTISIGRPGSVFGETLRTPRWPDIERVVNAIMRYPFTGDTSSRAGYRAAEFYAMSWLAVHYLQNTPELSRGFPDYIRLINAGEEPKKAFEDAFGLTQREFGRRLRIYWRANRFPIVQFQFTEAFEPAEFEVRTLNDRESDFSVAALRTIFLPRSNDGANHRRAVRRQLEQMERRHGPSVDLAAAFSRLEMAEGDYDESVRHGEAAAALAPEDPLALDAAGDAYYHRYLEDGGKDIADIDKSRAYFARALDVDPMNPNANHHYMMTFVIDGTPPDTLALEAVEFMSIYRRNPSYTSTHLDMADVLLAAQRRADACAMIRKVEPWVRRRAAEIESEKNESEEAGSDEAPVENELGRMTRLMVAAGPACEA